MTKSDTGALSGMLSECVLVTAIGLTSGSTVKATVREDGSVVGMTCTRGPSSSETLSSSGSGVTEARAGLTLDLPWPPTMNTYWRNWNGRTVISKAGREYRQAVVDQVSIQGGAKNFTGKLRVVIKAYRPDRRKRDLDNLLKASLDALTHAGVWSDDGLIVDLRIYWADDMGGRLEVEIYDGGSGVTGVEGGQEGGGKRAAPAGTGAA